MSNEPIEKLSVRQEMDLMSDEVIKSYCRNRGILIKSQYDINEIVHSYFHGELDLHKVFKKLGKDLVLQIANEI